MTGSLKSFIPHAHQINQLHSNKNQIPLLRWSQNQARTFVVGKNPNHHENERRADYNPSCTKPNPKMRHRTKVVAHGSLNKQAMSNAAHSKCCDPTLTNHSTVYVDHLKPILHCTSADDTLYPLVTRSNGDVAPFEGIHYLLVLIQTYEIPLRWSIRRFSHIGRPNGSKES